MKPVYQTQFYQEEPRRYGDCVRAVIASLLELPITEVPHFLELADGKAYEFYDGIEDFLNRYKLTMQWQSKLAYHWVPGDPDVYHYMSGVSPRNPAIGHAVVGLNGVPFFDPHPDGGFLAGDSVTWSSSFLVRIT